MKDCAQIVPTFNTCTNEDIKQGAEPMFSFEEGFHTDHHAWRRNLANPWTPIAPKDRELPLNLIPKP